MPWSRRPAGWEANPGSSSSRNFVVPVEPPASRLEFEGRSSELKLIHDRLKSASSERTAIICITGAPGIGKTALAIQYASRYRSSFPDGEIFTRLDHEAAGDSPVFGILGQFITALQRSDESVPPGLEDRRSRYLELTAEKRLLVILDNACHPACVRQLLPGGRSCATIITSRTLDQVLLADVLSQAFPIELERLSKDDSIRLLENQVGAGDIEQSGKLSHMIASSGNPIAIRFAAISLSRRPYWPPDETLGIGQELGGENAVSANLDLIYPLLTAEEKKALRCMALFEKRAFMAWELAALLQIAEPEAIRLADNLARVDLVRRTSGGPAGIVRFRVNEHILPYLQDKMPAGTLAEKQVGGLEVLERAQAERRRSDGAVLAELNTTVWALKDSGKIVAAFDLVRNAVASAQENQNPRLQALALATMSDLRVEIGNISGALELAEAAVRAAPEGGPARVLRCLGLVRGRQEEFGAAQDHLDQALARARQAEDRDRAEEVRILCEQAYTFALTQAKGKSSMAADEAVGLCRKHEDCASLLPSALYGKGRALLLCGMPQQAREQLDQAAVVTSAEQPLVRAWIDLEYSNAALKLKQPGAAIEAGSRAIEGFGAMSHRYGVACSRLALAQAYNSEGEDYLTEALASVSDALETLQNCEDRVTERIAKQLLASLLARRGQAGKSRSDLWKVAALYQELGDDVRARNIRDELKSSPLASRMRYFGSEFRQPAYWQRSVG
jgi:tetratricopeptide (TPR) repeat protein